MEDRTVPVDWPALSLGQLTWHWEGFVRPHLEGLTDEELHWEPVPGCWGVRRTAGGWAIDGDDGPQPDGPPFTTVAWRLWHLVEGVFGLRARHHFGAEQAPVVGDVEGTLAALDAAYDAWVAGVGSLGADGLARACGAHEGPFAEHSMAELVLHISREAIHHGAEVLELRDLYRSQPVPSPPAPIAFQVTFDAVDPHAQARFWAAALRYEVEDNDTVIRQLLDQGVVDHTDTVEVDGRMAWAAAEAIAPPAAVRGETGRLLFMHVPEPRPDAKNRLHLDLRVAGPERTPENAARLEDEVRRLEDLGARVLYRKDLPEGTWVTMSDPEGNELCLT